MDSKPKPFHDACVFRTKEWAAGASGNKRTQVWATLGDTRSYAYLAALLGVVPFGECILFKVAPDDKYEDRWGKGVVVGRSDQTDEFIVLIPECACKSRSVRRLEAKDQYEKEFLEKCVGSPWNPKNNAAAANINKDGDKLVAGARIHRLHIPDKLIKK